jgi:hypothetical protein
MNKGHAASYCDVKLHLTFSSFGAACRFQRHGELRQSVIGAIHPCGTLADICEI